MNSHEYLKMDPPSGKMYKNGEAVELSGDEYFACQHCPVVKVIRKDNAIGYLLSGGFKYVKQEPPCLRLVENETGS